jgi:hypothetical protein
MGKTQTEPKKKSLNVKYYSEGGKAYLFDPRTDETIIVDDTPEKVSQALDGGAVPMGKDGTRFEALKKSTTGSQAFFAGLGRGFTFGLSDYLDTKTGLKSPELKRAELEEHPTLSATGEIAGAVGQLAMPGVGLLGAGAKGAKLAGAGIKGVAKGLAREAVYGGAIGAGSELTEAAVNDRDIDFSSMLKKAAIGSAIGAGSAGVARGISWLGRKGGSLYKAAKASRAARKEANVIRGQMALDFGPGFSSKLQEAVQTNAGFLSSIFKGGAASGIKSAMGGAIGRGAVGAGAGWMLGGDAKDAVYGLVGGAALSRAGRSKIASVLGVASKVARVPVRVGIVAAIDRATDAEIVTAGNEAAKLLDVAEYEMALGDHLRDLNPGHMQSAIEGMQRQQNAVRKVLTPFQADDEPWNKKRILDRMTPEQVKQASSQIKAILDPNHVFAQIKDGKLDATQVELHREVYPEFHAETEQIMRRIVEEAGADLDERTTAQVSLLYGKRRQGMWNPATIQVFQKMHAISKADAKNKGGNIAPSKSAVTLGQKFIGGR